MTDPKLDTIFARWRNYLISFIAGEISRLTRYYDCVIQWQPRPEDGGLLLSMIDAKEKLILKENEPFPDLLISA